MQAMEARPHNGVDYGKAHFHFFFYLPAATKDKVSNVRLDYLLDSTNLA